MGLAEDLDSTELAEKLHAQTLVVDVLNRNLVRRDEEIEKLKARIAELEGGAKPVAKTSANSSVPPSRDPIGVPHTQSQRKPSGRKTGGQRGHQGSTRLQSGDVTGTERWYPAAGKVAGADETGVNVNGKNSWLWAFQNKAATYLAFDKSRSHDVVNRNFSPEEQRGTVRVTDRWPAYFMGDVGMEDHQVCIAHLLRNLTYTAQAFPDDAWSMDMLDLLRDSVHRRNRGEVGAGTRKNMEARLDELLARPPVYAKEDGDGTELDKPKKGIAKHRDHIFTFLTNPAVPPTNNDSEKALRPAKTKLKVSGCFRTESGAENYATVASVIQTAVKNGQNPFEVLRVIAALALAYHHCFNHY